MVEGKACNLCRTQHTFDKERETMLLRDYFDTRRTGTHDAYVGVPLADLSAKARGDALEGVIRRVLEQPAGEAATDPLASATASGHNSVYGVTTHGKDTQAGGGQVAAYASRFKPSITKATTAVCENWRRCSSRTWRSDVL